jgi:hypothetical protein
VRVQSRRVSVLDQVKKDAGGLRKVTTATWELPCEVGRPVHALRMVQRSAARTGRASATATGAARKHRRCRDEVGRMPPDLSNLEQ